MVQKSNNYIKELLLVALITSVFFGVFSALPMLLSSSNPFMPQPPGPGEAMRAMRPRPQTDPIIRILVSVVLMLSLWVMNIFLYARFTAMKGIEKKKNVLRYVASYVLMFVVVYLYYLVLRQMSLNPQYGRALFFPVVAGVTNNTIVVVLLELVVLQRVKAQVVLENAQLKMNSIQAQHQHLKHQLQPHFLFNSLNTLKTLIKRRPLEAEDYLVRLSEFLRASLTSDGKDTVLLRDEMKLCTDYLEMQKVRFKDAFRYEVVLPEPLMEAAFLPVFSLQLLAENAIKHNGFTSEDPLQIHIGYQEDGYLVVRNNKMAISVREPSSGIGLKNLRERYHALTEKAIVIDDDLDYFTVKLPILSK
ncbi:histidine kinase [Pontibacter sp. E15-1]|uniref:sensor histidine kinase n=1 Tax=Pontibacter sp. E15-1 TaxID=2919918 RepID=UPI001F4F682F|nr:histidine kinase [Pontibacter sp. E15-1]MCJ8164497.1 histidine kinase [Pontibacter sp. E15-1]